MHANYLGEDNISTPDRLKMAIQYFEASFDIKFDDSLKSNLAVNDCTAVDAMQEKIRQSEPFVKAFVDTNKQTDLESVVYQNLLLFYAQTFDRFSTYEAMYTSWLFNGASPLQWGIRFLRRSDYYENFLRDSDSRTAPHKPKYLFVESSASYLQKDLPYKTKIFQIDDWIVAEKTYSETLEYLMKKETHALSVERWNEAEQKYNDREKINVTFKTNNTRQITMKIINQKPYIGYMQIPTFHRSNLNEEFYKSWIEYLETYSEKLDGLILDMRGNGGGYTYQTQRLANTMFRDEDIVYHKIKKEKDDFEVQEERVEDPSPVRYGKIVVLTDFETASAAEIMTAALKDYNAALLVGEYTLGKGVGQNCYDYPASKLSGQACITNFYLFSPAGNSWYLKGIQPHIEVKEPANQNFYGNFTNIKKEVPAPYADHIDTDFNANADMSVEKLTPGSLEKLQSYYSQSTEDEKTCRNMDTSREEESCIYNWGVKLLKKWIELETLTQPTN